MGSLQDSQGAPLPVRVSFGSRVLRLIGGSIQRLSLVGAALMVLWMRGDGPIFEVFVATLVASCGLFGGWLWRCGGIAMHSATSHSGNSLEYDACKATRLRLSVYVLLEREPLRHMLSR